MNKRIISFRIDRDKHRRLKIYLAKKEKSFQNLVEEYINQLLEEDSKSDRDE